MAGKRQATSDLNHENWDREEEPEERGTFRTATKEEIKSRVMKKARRKIVDTNCSTFAAGGSSTSSKSVFSGFSGFGVGTPNTSTGSSPFSFLSKLPDTTAPSQRTNKVVSDESIGKTKIFENENIKNNSTYMEIIDDNVDGSKRKKYYSSLINLNRSFCDWIKLCIDNDPLCFLTPVLKDYEKFLEHLNKNDKLKDEKSSSHASIDKNVETGNEQIFSFSRSSAFADSGDNDTKPPTQNLLFGDIGSSFAAPKPNGFSLDNNKEIIQTSKTIGFSFTTGAPPFIFGNIQHQFPATEENTQDEENQPPKTEFKQVIEEDAVYSKKCKVFVKKDETFGERGVGTLYLKPVKGTQKTQLLVRADTNLGNILVNLILSSGIPVKRMGKNNVLLVCVPTPDENNTAPLLLRVKNESEADDLLATITNYQK